LEAIAVLQTEYLDRIRRLIDDIETRSAKQTDMAAEAIVAAQLAGGQLFVSPLGHGNDSDLLHRAGGLVSLHPFSFHMDVRDSIGGAERDREPAEPYDISTEAARVAVRSSRIRPGDCIIVGSVSGRSVAPISIAIAARESGVTVIGITSLDYSAEIAPIHPSGKRISDVSDIVIDNCAPFGDAALEVPGMTEQVIPISGVGTIMLCWMIFAQVIEKLLAKGLNPSHYISANRPGGPEFNRTMQEQFRRQGY
jgi:uncharacterized phosphosugar-binding protein